MTILNQVDIENGTVEVAEFTQTDAALADLRVKYSVIPDADTTDGYEFVKAGCKELTGLRTAIETRRKEIKAPYIQAGQIIDAEAKRITAAIVELEDPLKTAKKLVDDKEKRMKEERLVRLDKKINDIRANISMARGQSSERIAELISDVDAIDATQDFYERTNEAVTARAETLRDLGDMYSQQLNFEENERLRQEEETKRIAAEKANEIDRRISNLKMMPLDFMQRTKKDIENQVTRLENYIPAESDFGDRCFEADQARIEVIKQLKYMAEQKPVSESKPEIVKPELQPIAPPKIAALEESSVSAVIESTIKPVQMITLLVTCKATDRNRIEMMLGTVPDTVFQLID